MRIKLMYLYVYVIDMQMITYQAGEAILLYCFKSPI